MLNSPFSKVLLNIQPKLICLKVMSVMSLVKICLQSSYDDSGEVLSYLKTLFKNNFSYFSFTIFYQTLLCLWPMKHNNFLVFPNGGKQNMNLNCYRDEYLSIETYKPTIMLYRKKIFPLCICSNKKDWTKVLSHRKYGNCEWLFN